MVDEAHVDLNDNCGLATFFEWSSINHINDSYNALGGNNVRMECDCLGNECDFVDEAMYYLLLGLFSNIKTIKLSSVFQRMF